MNNKEKTPPSGASKKKLKGMVIAKKTDKTVTIVVSRFIKHKKYGKYVKVDKKYKAHDGENKFSVGDKVFIEECKPISKDKHFKVVEKI